MLAERRILIIRNKSSQYGHAAQGPSATRTEVAFGRRDSRVATESLSSPNALLAQVYSPLASGLTTLS